MPDMPPPAPSSRGIPAISNSAVMRSIEDATRKAQEAMRSKVNAACDTTDEALDKLEAAQDARITRSRFGAPAKRAKDRISPTARKAIVDLLQEGDAEDAAALKAMGYTKPVAAKPGTTDLP